MTSMLFVYAGTCAMQQPQVGDTIILALDDQHKYEVPKTIALQSKVIATMIQDLGESQEIPLGSEIATETAITPETMNMVAKIMRFAAKFPHLKKSALIQAIVTDIPQLALLSAEQREKLTQAGDFLNFELLEQLGDTLSNMITLIASDGKFFVVPLQTALESGLLKEFLENPIFEESKTRQITFKDINSATLQKVAQLMWLFNKNKNLKGKALLDAVQKEAQISGFVDPTDLLKVFDFLEFKPGIQFVTRTIAANEKLAVNSLKKLRGIEDLSKEIARYYFLLHGENLSGVPRDSYGFSVRDYLEYKPHGKYGYDRDQEIKIMNYGGYIELNLSQKRLNDLDGFREIPDINTVPELTLKLEHNQLTELPIDIFKGLTNLQGIDLSNNRLTQLPPTIFSGLNNLRDLSLTSNLLTQLPPNIFNGLNNLILLSIDHNYQLIQLPMGIFNGLNNLDKLFLGNNGFTYLPAEIFNGLNLRLLILKGNPLSEENKKQIRNALPGVEIYFEDRR